MVPISVDELYNGVDKKIFVFQRRNGWASLVVNMSKKVVTCRWERRLPSSGFEFERPKGRLLGVKGVLFLTY